MPYKIFDAHTHSYPPAIAERAVASLMDFYKFTFPLDAKGTYEDLREMELRGGSCGFMMFAAATNPAQVIKANDYIAKIMHEHSTPEMQIVAAGAMHHDYPDKLSEVERLITLGFKGFKIHPDIMQVDIDDPRFMDFYAMLEGRMLLYVHVGDDRYSYSDPQKLVKVARAFPKLTIIGAHLGGYRHWEQFEQNFLGTDIIVDTSSSLWALDPVIASRIINLHGADKVIFGTDYPVSSVEREIELFMKLDLTHEQREMILYGNAKRIFGLM